MLNGFIVKRCDTLENTKLFLSQSMDQKQLVMQVGTLGGRLAVYNHAKSFNLKDFLKHVDTLAQKEILNASEKDTNKYNTLDDILKRIEQLDQEGQSSLKNSNPLTRIFTALRRLFGGRFDGAKIVEYKRLISKEVAMHQETPSQQNEPPAVTPPDVKPPIDTKLTSVQTPPMTQTTETTSSPPIKKTRIKRSLVDVSELQNIVKAYGKVEEACRQAEEIAYTTDGSITTVQLFSTPEIEQIKKKAIKLMNEIIKEFKKEKYRERFGYNQEEDKELFIIKFQEPVPSYYANVKETNSDYRLIYCSLLGIRNLIEYGPKLFDDFRKEQFIDGEHNYSAGTGLAEFKDKTGNLVDLNTELERPMVKNHEGHMQRRPLTDAEATEKYKKMVIDFGNRVLGINSPNALLSFEEVIQSLKKRKLGMEEDSYIHISRSNTDRGKFGIWKRIDAYSREPMYYVNVPQMPAVVLATLRLPYLLAEVAALDEAKNKALSNAFFDTFFDGKRLGGCFNAKAQSMIDFSVTQKEILLKNSSPEDEVTKAIESGSLGDELKKMGAEKAIEDAWSRNRLVSALVVIDESKEILDPDRFQTLLVEDDNPLWQEKDFAKAIIDHLEKNEPEKLKKIEIALKFGKSLYQEDEDSPFKLVTMQLLPTLIRDYKLANITSR